MVPARGFRAGGFTLIELLVAVSLLSVLLLLLFSAMRTGMRSWQVAETRIDAVEGVAQVERFLVRIVSQARGRAASMAGPTTWGDLDPLRRKGLFEGESDRFVLVAPGVNALPPGLYRYEVFFLERSGGEGDLWVRIDPYRPNDQTLGEPRLLREDVAGFAVRYFSGPADGSGGEWMNEWPSEGRGMPVAIEIRIQSGDGEARPAIIAAPAVAEMT
jgi:general secretion pathway protein J